MDPERTSSGRAKDIPSLHAFGRISFKHRRKDSRSAAKRGVTAVQSLMSLKSRGRQTTTSSFRGSQSKRLYSDEKTAHLFTESTIFRHVKDTRAPKAWFKGNVNRILSIYGREHDLSREKLFLVTGTLEARDYALFVNHNHPNGKVNFDIYSSAATGMPWGHFSTTIDLSTSQNGSGHRFASRISKFNNHREWDALLLAKLRFIPNSSEPTTQ